MEIHTHRRVGVHLWPRIDAGGPAFTQSFPSSIHLYLAVGHSRISLQGCVGEPGLAIFGK